MSKGHKKNVRVGGSVNQRLKAAQKNAAKLEAERAANKGESVEDDDSAPLSGDQEAVDDHSGDASSDAEDVTENDSADDGDSPHVDDPEDGYSGGQEATDDGTYHDSYDEWAEDDSPLPMVVDVVGDAFDDTDERYEEGESSGEEDELDDVVPTRNFPVRRSAALPDGYPLVGWEVIDALGDDGDWLPRWSIQANPPTLVLYETETGQQIEMKLTRKVARDLDYSIHGIMSIYEEGVAYPEPRRTPIEWVKSGWWAYWGWVGRHKIIGTVTSALSVVMILVLATSLVGTSLVSLFGGGFLGGEVER